ncbi:MAG: lipoate--protein ligase family protein [Bacillota bacterium]
MYWRLIITRGLDACTNMAIDEAILSHLIDGSAPPTIRFYTWDPPAVSIGYFQDMEAEVDRESCQEEGCQWIRRITGGRAVLHDQEVTYSVVAREEHPLLPGGIEDTYLRISACLVAGLSYLGVEAKLAPGTKKGLRTAACFDSASRHEILVGGKKVIGSAQVRRGGCFLQHGSVLLDLDVDKLFTVLRFSIPSSRARENFLRHAGCLRELKKEIDTESVLEALTKGFTDQLGIALNEEALSAGEQQTIKELIEKKYASSQWNLRKITGL